MTTIAATTIHTTRAAKVTSAQSRTPEQIPIANVDTIPRSRRRTTTLTYTQALRPKQPYLSPRSCWVVAVADMVPSPLLRRRGEGGRLKPG